MPSKGSGKGEFAGNKTGSFELQIISSRGCSFLNEHIYKEDNVLFPLAEKHLPDKKQAELHEGFEKIEVEKIGIGKHDEFHNMLDQLEHTYLMNDKADLETSQTAGQLA